MAGIRKRRERVSAAHHVLVYQYSPFLRQIHAMQAMTDLFFTACKESKFYSLPFGLQSWTKLLRKLCTWGAFFLHFVADRFFPPPLPLEAMLLGLQKKAGSLSICRKQL